MTDKNSYTYEAAFKELQEIVQQIELGDVNIDQLSDYIKRAATLVKICEAKLTDTEEEVQSLLEKLNEEESTNATDLEDDKVEEENDEEYEPSEAENNADKDSDKEVENEEDSEGDDSEEDIEDFTGSEFFGEE